MYLGAQLHSKCPSCLTNGETLYDIYLSSKAIKGTCPVATKLMKSHDSMKSLSEQGVPNFVMNLTFLI